MPTYEIRVTKRPVITSPAFTSQQMRAFGDKAIATMKTRLDQNRNVLDMPSKPLSANYAERKRKRGRAPIRDMWFTGGMRNEALQVIDASAEKTLVSVTGTDPRTGQRQYRKGIFNQNIDPWFGLSPTDEQEVMGEVHAAWESNVRKVNETPAGSVRVPGASTK